MKLPFHIICITGIALAAAGESSAAPRNIILMITDGRAYGVVDATRAWTGRKPPYAGKGWTRYSMSTFSASNSEQENPLGYDPNKAWSRGDDGALKPNQAYLKTNATDSASGITAIVTGQKNLDGQINWSVQGKPIRNMAELYKANGRAAGCLSTVHWTHATPAGIGAHNASRSRYVDIATEMLTKSNLDVIMGAGNPYFDDNGAPAATANYANIGFENWKSLVSGTSGYKLIHSRSDFVALGTAETTPQRVCGTFDALSTAQQGRSGYSATDVPGSDPRNPLVPTMGEMALAALNVLDINPKGFFVMMEGGAIDWAAHANQSSRLIEEQMDFDAAVQAVCDWVETRSSWKDTLVIVTSDHANGMITGPDGETTVVDNGSGKMPGLKWNSGTHTNELVPLYVRGAGAGVFKTIASKSDPVRGPYCDNTDVFRAMAQAAGVE